MALVQGTTSFYVLRFLLGAAEVGFFPGIILYLSYWFPARKRAAVTALFMAAAPLSTALGSPISGALLEMHGILGLAGWQWMFLIEAVPAVILGVVVLFYMTDRPEKAKWLADDERAWLVNEMNAERAAKSGTASHSIWHGLADLEVLALALVYFGTSAGLYTLGIWAPQIIKEFGLTSLRSASSMPSQPPSRLRPWCCGPVARTGPVSANGTWSPPACWRALVLSWPGLPAPWSPSSLP